jgi:hypothetical protein
MSNIRDLAFAIDPALWVQKQLGVKPADWQAQFLRAPRGASIIVLTARQVGKTTAAAWAMTHFMLYNPGGLSVIACPSQRQSAEAVRRVKDHLLALKVKLKVDNVYGLELETGSRVLALPSSDDSIRGLTVDGWIVADEASRLTNDLISALRPMRARRPQARLAMLSTAYSRTDPFWTAWAGDDSSWIRLKATADVPGAVSCGISRTRTKGVGGAPLQLGISGNSCRRICQPVRLGFVRACHPNSRPFGADGDGVCAIR